MPRHKRAPGEGAHVDSRRRGGSARTVSVRRQQFLDQKRERRRERLAGRALARAAAKPATGDEPGVDAPPRAPEPAVRLAEWLWRFGAEAEGVVPEPLPRLLFGGSLWPWHPALCANVNKRDFNEKLLSRVSDRALARCYKIEIQNFGLPTRQKGRAVPTSST